MDVHLEDADGAADPAAYDAVVLGSAVYSGKWLPPGPGLRADARVRSRGKRPVWLFAVVRSENPPKPDGGPSDLDPRGLVPGARDHAVFGGRIDRDLLGTRERLVTRVAVGADEGDFRDWEEVASWASAIADELRVEAVR